MNIDTALQAAMETLPVVEPMLDPELAPYWDGARAGELMLSRCPVCEAVPWSPRAFCPEHPDAKVEWFRASGGGTIHSWTRVHRGEGAFAGAAPYLLAYVELDEGPRVLTTIVVTEGEEPSIGLRVNAVFDQRPSAGAVLRFVLTPERVPQGQVGA
ncbi:Zn-ribbon domain-containing OB-fold protein [Streptomyces sp. NPDC097610]|uniref:Zn-ribbon domain-containing OB-fold protein n=1 Tax=Streptomyces sp. NPDC097610 TaxID=3157227 RepID=UPI0033164CD3